MKPLLLVILLTTVKSAFAQYEDKIRLARLFIEFHNIKLNTVSPPPGFKVYYNCDSMLFMRADMGDTIKIMTPGATMPQELNDFEETMKGSSFGITTFASDINSDGRITVQNYHETVFIYRNDSLFQLADTADYPDGFFEIFHAYMNEKIDEATYKKRKDSLDQLFYAKSLYVPKLIFSKNMFKKGKKKVKLSKKVNFMEDTIVLENQWMENGRQCYVVRINNKEKDGTETTYAYALNEKMEFIWWQGCNTQQQRRDTLNSHIIQFKW